MCLHWEEFMLLIFSFIPHWYVSTHFWREFQSHFRLYGWLSCSTFTCFLGSLQMCVCWIVIFASTKNEYSMVPCDANILLLLPGRPHCIFGESSINVFPSAPWCGFPCFCASWWDFCFVYSISEQDWGTKCGNAVFLKFHKPCFSCTYWQFCEYSILEHLRKAIGIGTADPIYL